MVSDCAACGWSAGLNSAVQPDHRDGDETDDEAQEGGACEIQQDEPPAAAVCPTVLVAGHSFFHTRIALSSMTEFARILMVAATTASSCAGGHPVGRSGHLSRMVGGRSGDSANSISSSSAPLTGPRASWVVCMVGLAFVVSGFQARSVLAHRSGRLCVAGLAYLAYIWHCTGKRKPLTAAFPLVRGLNAAVGDTGFEPVTSSVSAIWHA